jgi:Glycosyltransferase family 87
MYKKTSMNASTTWPRAGFILTTAMLILFYGVFAGSSVRLLRVMHAGPETLTAQHELPQSDFGLFWCAGKGLAAKAAVRFGLGGPAPAYKQICQLDILADNAPQALAWPYPPPAGFVVTPFAALQLPLAFWAWRVVSLVLAGWLLHRCGLGWMVILAGLASPAALHDMAGGQNGTLSGAVLVAALLLAPERPRIAGVLAGLLTLKPQLGILFPAIIWRRGGWQLVLAGAITVLILVLASLAVWGPGQWSWFLHVAEPNEMRTAALPFASFFPAAGVTVYDMARSLGAAPHLAWAVQAAAAVLALMLTYAIWREGRMQPMPRMALTTGMALLAMPHGYSYDLVGFSLGMAALYFLAGQWERLILACLWLMGGYTITLADYTGLLLFPLWAACGAAMAWRLRNRQAGEALRAD